MRLLRICVALVSLCLILAAPALAAEGPPRPAREETGPVARLAHGLGALLKAVWDKTAWEIDPLGQPAQQKPPAPGTDSAWEIDPWG